jgi:hypothetical protein
MANATKNARKSSNCFGVAEHQAARLDKTERRVIEGARLVVQVDDGGEHQHRAGHRVEEELDGRVDAPLVSPDADQEVHRDERDFPEHVEKEQVERCEDADYSEFQEKQEGVVHLLPLPDVVPGDQYAMGVSNVDRTISQRLTPSMPT